MEGEEDLWINKGFITIILIILFLSRAECSEHWVGGSLGKRAMYSDLGARQCHPRGPWRRGKSCTGLDGEHGVGWGKSLRAEGITGTQSRGVGELRGGGELRREGGERWVGRLLGRPGMVR